MLAIRKLIEIQGYNEEEKLLFTGFQLPKLCHRLNLFNLDEICVRT